MLFQPNGDHIYRSALSKQRGNRSGSTCSPIRLLYVFFASTLFLGITLQYVMQLPTDRAVSRPTNDALRVMEQRVHDAEDKAHRLEMELQRIRQSEPASDELGGGAKDDVGGHPDTEDVVTDPLPVETESGGHGGELITPAPQTREEFQRALTLRAGKIYCAVPTMYEPRKFDQWNAILESWGQYCDVIKLFVDPLPEADEGKVDPIPSVYVNPHTQQSVDLVVLPMVRRPGNMCWSGGGRDKHGKVRFVPCRHIWEKVWRMWVYVEANDEHLADWFLKVDDDTFVIVENLKRFIIQKGWKPTEKHYFGHKLYHAQPSLIAGALVVFSHATLLEIAPVYGGMEHEYGDRSKFKHGRCVDRDGATEERTTGICLHQTGIAAEETARPDGAERVLLFTIADSFNLKRKPTSRGWYWHMKPKHHTGYPNCCAIDLIAVHHLKRSDEMRRFHRCMYDEHSELEELMANKERMSNERQNALQNMNPKNTGPVIKTKSLERNLKVSAEQLVLEVEFMKEVKAFLWDFEKITMDKAFDVDQFEK